jgi:RNA polymerase sigma-70 factor (ECF subfamily)
MSVAAASATQERGLLAAARNGDEGAFARLVEPYRGELHAHCYRMLGSLHDAEDALQEALLRAWRGLGRFQARGSVRPWLYKIATNTSLDTIAKRPKRVMPIDYGPAADPHSDLVWPDVEKVWVEPYPDEQLGLASGFAAPEARYELRESVELAFIAALQFLPATQRAVLILREVLGFSAAEVGDLLDTTVASVNSALQRARKTVDERLPEQSQQETLRSLGDEEIRDLVERYVDAWERGDADAVVAMLAKDASFTMPPQAIWFHGADDIRAFLPTGPLSIRRRFIPLRSNGQLAFGTYKWVEDEGRFVGNAVHVLTLRGKEIVECTCFLTLDVFPAFGLETHLPG